MDYTQFSSIFIIPLPETPNSSFNVIINGETFEIEFRAMGNRMLLYISIGDKILLNGVALKYAIPLNAPTQHLFNGGYFWIEGKGDPVFSNFSNMEFYFGSF